MTALFRSRWGRFGLVLVFLAAMAGLFALAGYDRVSFFYETKLAIFPFDFLFMFWSLGLIFGSLFVPLKRRTRVTFAGLAMLMFAGVFRGLDAVTLWGLTQAVACGGAITWMGFGGGGMDGPADGGDRS